MLISVIIPVYKVEKYVERCIDSILNQTYKKTFECVVVNDCTPDDSMSIIRRVVDCNRRTNIQFKFVEHESNRGLSAARNSGIINSTGDFVFFLDSDDEICANAIEEFYRLLEKYNPDIIQGNIYNNSNKVQWLDITNSSFPEYTNDINYIRKNWLSFPAIVCNKLIRKSIITDNNLYFKEGILHEDNYWMLFSKEYISSIAFTTMPTYIYYVNEDSIMTNSYKDKSIVSQLFISKEYFMRCPCGNDNKAEYNMLFGHLLNCRKNLLYKTKDYGNIKKQFDDFVIFFLKKKILSLKYKMILFYFLFPTPLIKIRVVKLLQKF